MQIYKKPKLKDPYLIAAWPGMGEVALQAADYLRRKLRAEKFAVIEEPEFFQPTGVEIKKGLIEMPGSPQGIFYYYKNRFGKNDLVIFVSEAQPHPDKSYEYAHELLDLAEELGVKKFYTFAAIPVPIDHLQTPKVMAAATHREMIKEIHRQGIKLMTRGQISGLNGLLLGAVKERGIKGICILSEIPLYTIQIENPKASQVVLEALLNMLNIKISMVELEERSEYIEEEIGRLIDAMKASIPSGPMSDDEVERLKNGLAAYTRLPLSAKDRIEKLFKEATRDTSKANTLKEELDRWNVYKKYEDRFLDLFKKGKSQR